MGIKMSKSVDLREAAVHYYLDGHTYEETRIVFGVSYTAVHSWVEKYRQSGDLSNKPLNRSFRKIDPEKLRAYVKEHPDDTQREMAAALGRCHQAISQALKRYGITRKKKRRGTKNRTPKK